MRRVVLFLLLPLLFAACTARVVQDQPEPAPAERQPAAQIQDATILTEDSLVAEELQQDGNTAEPQHLPAERIPVLVYHHIREHQGWHKSTWSWKMTVSPTVFAQHMQWLADRGYTAIDLDTLVRIFYGGEETGPAKPVVITFDDNNPNTYENGLPALLEHGHIAVFYLVANRMENPAFLSKEHIRDLAAHGMDIQSHTMTHANLTALGRERLQWELTESKRMLEELSNRPVRHVSYPLTAHSAIVREAARQAGYVTGSIMDPRPAHRQGDLMKLPRIMMTDDTDLEAVLP